MDTVAGLILASPALSCTRSRLLLRRGFSADMPASEMLGMGTQIGSWLKEGIIVLQIQVVRLHIHQHKDRRDRGRELTEGVKSVLRLQSDALAELLIVHLGAATHLAALFPGSRRIGMEGATRSEFALAEMIHRRPHVRIMRWCMPFKNARETGGIGESPALIGIVAETKARHIRIATRTQDCQAIYAIEHPSAQSQRLLHQYPCIGRSRELSRTFRERILIQERQRQGRLHINDICELLNTGNTATVHIIIDTEAILHKETEIGDRMLGHIARGNDQQR